jgi:FdhD protein
VPVTLRRIQRGETGGFCQSGDFSDEVAAEVPLTLRVEGRAVAVVMRTPGHDRELAAGFMLTEGVIRSRADLFEISLCPSLSRPAASDRSDRSDSGREGREGEAFFANSGSVDIMLTNPAAYDPERLTRHVFTSSSCGVCGKTDLENPLALHGPALVPAEGPVISAEELFALPACLREAQAAFASTGGLHGCAWFPVEVDQTDPPDRPDLKKQAAAGSPAALASKPALVFEDVGRHNALDKLLGSALLSGQLPLTRGVLLLSGRISFELVQKAATARIPIIAAIGAPSSLAVEYAAAAGITLCGFLRDGRVNVYTHAGRILAVDGNAAAPLPPPAAGPH